jgi:hypothetical protein
MFASRDMASWGEIVCKARVRTIMSCAGKASECVVCLPEGTCARSMIA